MTREEFIQILDKKDYSYKIIGDKLVVTENRNVNLSSLETLPPGVVFMNKGDVLLSGVETLPLGVVTYGGYVDVGSLETLPPDVQFNNKGDVYLGSLTGDWFSNWKGNIEGIDSNTLLNVMIKRGMFI